MKPRTLKCACGFDFTLAKEIQSPVEVICPKCKNKKIIEPVTVKKGGND